MKNEEKELFFELCKFKNSNKEKLKDLITKGAATPQVLGYLFGNRMAATAYGVMNDNELTSSVDREFRNSLKNAYLQNKMKNESYFICLKIISEILHSIKDKYVLLKGAYLCKWYPEGYRTSNDVDVLVNTSNVTIVGEMLTEAGFKQGSILNDNFIPAKRSEIIYSKMTRGETVPYIKEVNLPFMKYLEVDINYSLDYKNTKGSTVPELIARSSEIIFDDLNIVTLEKYDFFIHLCGHLYKEATTLPWIKMKRDLTLYKFCDLYALLAEYKNDDFLMLVNRINELKMNDICYFALYMTRELFDLRREGLDSCIRNLKIKEEKVLNSVIAPSEKKVYHYKDKDIRGRFFADDRTLLLKEVKEND